MFSFRPGPDPDFPHLTVNDYYAFPDPKKWKDDIISIGGNLSPGMLLSAYEQGIFPWYNPGDPVLWQSPDPRFVIFPEKLHISTSMKKVLRNKTFNVTFDKDFEGVIRGCAEVFRPYQQDIQQDSVEQQDSTIPQNSIEQQSEIVQQSRTWISDDIIKAYTELHHKGWAHSAEAWQEGTLVGGCYGVLMGKVFIGESMFSKKSNASKAAFLTLAKKLFESGLAFIDCQLPTQHLASFGGEEMSRSEYLVLLRKYNVSRF